MKNKIKSLLFMVFYLKSAKNEKINTYNAQVENIIKTIIDELISSKISEGDFFLKCKELKLDFSKEKMHEIMTAISFECYLKEDLDLEKTFYRFYAIMNHCLDKYKSILFPGKDPNSLSNKLDFKLVTDEDLNLLSKTKEIMANAYMFERLTLSYSNFVTPIIFPIYDKVPKEETNVEKKICKKIVSIYKKMSANDFKKIVENYYNRLISYQNIIARISKLDETSIVKQRIDDLLKMDDESIRKLMNKAQERMKSDEFILKYIERFEIEKFENIIKKSSFFQGMDKDNLDDLICEHLCESEGYSNTYYLISAMVLFPFSEHNLNSFVTPTNSKQSNPSNKKDNNNSNKTAYIVGGVVVGVLLLSAAYYLYQSNIKIINL